MGVCRFLLSFTHHHQARAPASVQTHTWTCKELGARGRGTKGCLIRPRCGGEQRSYTRYSEGKTARQSKADSKESYRRSVSASSPPLLLLEVVLLFSTWSVNTKAQHPHRIRIAFLRLLPPHTHRCAHAHAHSNSTAARRALGAPNLVVGRK